VSLGPNLRARRPAGGAPVGGPPVGGPMDTWMVTFTDLLTLLVTLFVLFISMAALREGFVLAGPNPNWAEGTARSPIGGGDLRGRPDSGPQTPGIGEAGARVQHMRKALSRAGLPGGYGLYFDDRGMVLRFFDPLLGADDRVTPDGARRLQGLAAYVAESGRKVEVTAHAGGRGLAGFGVAARRADAVAGQMVSEGAPGMLVVPVARTAPFGALGVEGEADTDGLVIFVFGD
jgi:chemotaxis protein MotB